MTTTLDTVLQADDAHKLRMKLQQEVDQAVKAQRPYAILACVPHGLPGEIASDEVVSVAMECVLGLIRDGDQPGLVGRDIVVLGLSDTDHAGVQVLAQRLQSELTLRSAALKNTGWESGFACLPEDGLTAGELVDAAIRSARNHRRRLAG